MGCCRKGRVECVCRPSVEERGDSAFAPKRVGSLDRACDRPLSHNQLRSHGTQGSVYYVLRDHSTTRRARPARHLGRRARPGGRAAPKLQQQARATAARPGRPPRTPRPSRPIHVMRCGRRGSGACRRCCDGAGRRAVAAAVALAQRQQRTVRGAARPSVARPVALAAASAVYWASGGRDSTSRRLPRARRGGFGGDPRRSAEAAYSGPPFLGSLLRPRRPSRTQPLICLRRRPLGSRRSHPITLDQRAKPSRRARTVARTAGDTAPRRSLARSLARSTPPADGRRRRFPSPSLPPSLTPRNTKRQNPPPQKNNNNNKRQQTPRPPRPRPPRPSRRPAAGRPPRSRARASSSTAPRRSGARARPSTAARPAAAASSRWTRTRCSSSRSRPSRP